MRRLSGQTAAARGDAGGTGDFGGSGGGSNSGGVGNSGGGPRALRPGAMRGRVAALLDLARHLPTQDRALIEQVFVRGASAAEIARLRGQSPRATQKRLKALIARMRSREYRLLAERDALVPADARAAAHAVVFARRSLRDTARLTHQSLHTVRRHMQTIRALARL